MALSSSSTTPRPAAMRSRSLRSLRATTVLAMEGETGGVESITTVNGQLEIKGFDA